MANNTKSDAKKQSIPSIKTRIDYRGRIYVPIEIRKKLKIKPDDEINLECEGNSIILSLHRNTRERH